MDDYFKYYTIRRRKLLNLAAASFAAFFGPITTTIYIPAIPDVKREFGATTLQVNMTIFSYTFVMIFVPLIASNLSDRFGRRKFILIGLIGYCVTCLWIASAPNIYLLMFFRMTQAVFTSPINPIGSALVIDQFTKENLGLAMSFFSISALTGPLIGPMVGGILSTFISWRAIFLVLCALGCIVFVFCLIVLEETLPSKVLKSTKVDELTDADVTRISQSFKKPKLKNYLLFLKSPSIGVNCLAFGSTFGIMYMMIILFPTAMSEEYGLTSGIIGIMMIPYGIVNLIGLLIGGKLSDLIFKIIPINESRAILYYLSMVPFFISVMMMATSISISQYLVVVMLAFVAFFQIIGRPGLMSFIMNENRALASTSMGIFRTHMSTFSTVATLITDPALKLVQRYETKYEYAVLFFAVCVFSMISSMPGFIFLVVKLGIAAKRHFFPRKVDVEKDEDEYGSEGDREDASSTDELLIEMKEGEMEPLTGGETPEDEEEGVKGRDDHVALVYAHGGASSDEGSLYSV